MAQTGAVMVGAALAILLAGSLGFNVMLIYDVRDWRGIAGEWRSRATESIRLLNRCVMGPEGAPRDEQGYLLEREHPTEERTLVESGD